MYKSLLAIVILCDLILKYAVKDTKRMALEYVKEFFFYLKGTFFLFFNHNNAHFLYFCKLNA